MIRSTPSLRLATLAALVAAGSAGAQVTPSEPFGGRPFGAAPGTPAPGAAGVGGTAQQPVLVTPQQPVIVTPQQPVVVAPAPQPPVQQAQPAQPVVQPPAPAPAPAPMPSAVVGAPAQQQATPANGTGTPRGAAPAPAPAAQAPAAPAPLAPPFNAAANRPAPAASGAQPVARGLPADAPKVVISGSVWSRDPARRRLIVNGQPVREGADLGQGLVVQEVRRESAVLGYKGAQYNVWF
jgi:general secretion pathway protein B